MYVDLLKACQRNIPTLLVLGTQETLEQQPCIEHAMIPTRGEQAYLLTLEMWSNVRNSFIRIKALEGHRISLNLCVPRSSARRSEKEGKASFVFRQPQIACRFPSGIGSTAVCCSWDREFYTRTSCKLFVMFG